MIEALLERSSQLIDLKRFDEAEKNLKEILSQNPNEVEAIALLAICKSEQSQYKESLTLIQQAIKEQPDNDYYLYLHALFSLRNDELKIALQFINNAIAFNPFEANYFGLLSSIFLNKKEWRSALESANKGLEIDAQNLICLNNRSTSLFKLDRKEEAFVTVDQALQEDPENDLTHTNVGWGHLEKGNSKKALEHFREALKINPENEYAKAGLVEGLKARYLFYRIFLKYVFWMSNLKGKLQWGVILGFYFGSKLLKVIANDNPSIELFITPIIILYTVFAVSTWIITPLSNLFLRLNVYGRYALTEEELKSSSLVGLAFCLGVIGIVGYLISSEASFGLLFFFGFTMMIPLSSVYSPIKERSKNILAFYAIALFSVGVITIVLEALNGEAGIFPIIYLIGWVAYGWVANALIIKI